MLGVPVHKIIKGILVVGIGILLFLAAFSDYLMRHGKSNYTIGTITNYTRGGKTAPWFDYEFELGGQTFSSSYWIEGEMSMRKGSYLQSYIGRRFLVKYKPDDKKLNRLLLSCPVSDSTLIPSLQGWKTPPFECDEDE